MGQWKDVTYYDPGSDLESGDTLFNNIMNTSPVFQLALQMPYFLQDAHGELITPGVVTLPYTSRDNYSCYSEEIGSRVEMLSGKTVWESRGRIMKIHYAYDSMPPQLWRKVSAILRSSDSFTAYYLRDDDPVNMYEGVFLCESLTPPKFAYAEPDYYITDSDEYLALPRWHGIDFTLRELAPNTRRTMSK